MALTNTESLEKNQVKLSFAVTALEAQPFLEEAAKHLSEVRPIAGFRPGHATYEVAKNQYGEMAILESALESIIRKSFIEVVLEQNLETVGSPDIHVEKLAPGNDIVFTVTVTRMPQAKSLPDMKKLSIAPHNTEVTAHDIDLALRDLTRMQTKETRVQGETLVGATDKVVISMDMKKDGVSVEGGQSPNHAIYLEEEYYIPGFKEQIIGLKEGDQKSFTLTFPKEHKQEFLAGKEVEFSIHLKEHYHLATPEINDELGKSLGMNNLEELKSRIEQNIKTEKAHKDRIKEEREMLELLASKTQFDDIPDLMLNEEINKMIAELKRGVEEQGADFENYIASLKKTLAQMKMDFTPQALTRIKVALILKAVGKEEKIEAVDSEIDAHLDETASQYEDKETKAQIYSPQYREYIRQVLSNRKVIDHLRAIIVHT